MLGDPGRRVRAAEVLSGRLQEDRGTMDELAPKLGRDRLLDLLNKAINRLARRQPSRRWRPVISKRSVARLEAARVEYLGSWRPPWRGPSRCHMAGSRPGGRRAVRRPLAGRRA